jgi:DNA polymerase beta
MIEEFHRLLIYMQNKLTRETDPQKASIYRFKIKSIGVAIAALGKLKKRIRKVSDVDGIPGIGTGTKSRIEEILKTGKLSEIKGVSKTAVHNADAVRELLSVINIGEALAKKLVAQGVKSVADLQRKVASGKIKVGEKVKIGLKYAGTAAPIPRAEIDQIKRLLLRELAGVDKRLIGQICGSYRRGRSFSNDVDFLFIHPDIEDSESSDLLERFIERLQRRGYVVDSLTGSDVKTKFMGFFRLNKNGKIRRIDIRFLPARSFPTAELYFTGPGPFNQKMRSIAKRKGYKLNEYGLYRHDKVTDDWRRVAVKSEKDVFRALDIEYLTPEERDTAQL